MNRITRSITMGTLSMLLLSAVSAIGDQFPYPKVDFDADLTMTIKQGGGSQPHVIQGRIHSSKGNERREISRMGRTTAIIKRRDKDETYTLMPAQKMYMVNKGNDSRDPERMIRDGEMTLTKQGKEKVNGHSTTKYKISSTGNTKETFDGHAWFTKDNIPVRIIGKASDGNMSNNVQIDYANIRKARQPATLFEIPPGFRPISTGMPTGAPAGFGGPKGKVPPGLTPEQMEQLKKIMQQKKGG